MKTGHSSRHNEDRFGTVQRLATSGGIAIARNPVRVGGTTAFAVALMFFGANALWYQPHPHKGAFFQTRPMVFSNKQAEREPVMKEWPPKNANARDVMHPADKKAETAVRGDPVVQKVQEVLSDLNLYTGSIDGLQGPQTRNAIISYRQIIGLDKSDEIDEKLLEHLGATTGTDSGNANQPAPAANAVIPVPTPRGDEVAGPSGNIASVQSLETGIAEPYSLAIRVQAGLREFGNDAIVLDGKVGSQTITAIREFQSLFGLPVTGVIDNQLIAKMEEIGLISR